MKKKSLFNQGGKYKWKILKKRSYSTFINSHEWWWNNKWKRIKKSGKSPNWIRNTCIISSWNKWRAYILSREEKEQVLKIVVDEAKGRVPVYGGTGCISTKETIELSLKAKEIGVDVLSIITPSFAAASQDELYEHYKEVAKAVDLPIVLYNIPARTGNALAPATVEKLSKIPNIVGVKDSSGNFDNMLQYIEKTRYRKDFAVLSGNDSLILWCLLAGGRGGIAGCANVFPSTMASIYDTFIAGNLDKAREIQDSIRSFRDCLNLEIQTLL